MGKVIGENFATYFLQLYSMKLLQMIDLQYIY